MKTHPFLSFASCILFQLLAFQGLTLGTYSSLEFNRTQPVQDTTPPVVNCNTGANILSLPASGCILIWAKDLDRGSIDDITPGNKLKFYLNGDPGKPNIQICCSDFLSAGACDEYTLNLEMWVEDEAGNKSVCKTTVFIQDDLDACSCQSSGFSIKGFIGNRCNTRSEANLKLTGPNNYSRTSFGPYIRYYELLTGPYQLCLERNDYPLNGVSTADIVKIQRHILGIEYFNQSTQILAADVNNSSTITTADITEIRKLILGVKSAFSKVPSWIFVPSDSLLNPARLPHVNDYKDGCWNFELKNTSLDSLNFTSIKMGDVNCTAKLTEQSKIELRNKPDSYLLTYSSRSENNQFVSTDFKFDQNIDIQALQLTLLFDASQFEFETIKAGQISLSEEHISLEDIGNGKIHIAWNKDQNNRIPIHSGILFSVRLKTKSNSNHEPLFYFDPLGIKPLLTDPELNELDITLKELTSHGLFIKSIAQNRNILYINYTSGYNVDSNYSLTDLNGRNVANGNIRFQKERQIESIPLNSNLSAGIYLLQIHSKLYSATFKVIILG